MDNVIINRCRLHDGVSKAECNHSLPTAIIGLKICCYNGICKDKIQTEVFFLDCYKPVDATIFVEDDFNEKQ